MSYSNLTDLFTDIADAIRAKTGGSGTIAAEDFPTEIAAIPSGGGGGGFVTGVTRNSATKLTFATDGKAAYFVVYEADSSYVAPSSNGTYYGIYVIYDGETCYCLTLYRATSASQPTASWQTCTVTISDSEVVITCSRAAFRGTYNAVYAVE